MLTPGGGMGSRTYIPTAIRLLKQVCKYLLAHRDRINQVVSGENTGTKVLIDNVLEACEALTEAIAPSVPQGD